MIPEKPANRLAFDPDLRSSILERIRTQKEREYAGLHRPWLDAQPLSEDDRSTLTTRLVDYDVWVASQLMPGETITTPSETEIEFEFIAEERSRLIANIAEEFGEDIAESYVQAFPGPEPGQFVRLSDDMSPMPPIPTDFVPENAEPPTDQLPANR